ncbi:MAG: hypothetical protein ACK5PF_08900 [bacterium]
MHPPLLHAAESPYGLSGVEYQLAWLSRHGAPSLRLMEKGWHANIDMRTPYAGTQFCVRAGFEHSTPGYALELLISRVKDVLAGASR